MLKALSISCPNPNLRKHEKIEGGKERFRGTKTMEWKKRKQGLRNEFEEAGRGGVLYTKWRRTEKENKYETKWKEKRKEAEINKKERNEIKKRNGKKN